MTNNNLGTPVQRYAELIWYPRKKMLMSCFHFQRAFQELITETNLSYNYCEYHVTSYLLQHLK